MWRPSINSHLQVFLCNFRIVGLKFSVDLIDVIYRITSFCSGCVYDMDHHFCPLNVT